MKMTRRRLPALAAGLATSYLAHPAWSQSTAAVVPRSGSAPDKLPDNARPIEAAPDAPTATEIRSPEEAKHLLGHKPLTWKYLADQRGNKPGGVDIIDEGGLWHIRGEQRGSLPGTENDSVRIEGVILRILPNMFTIKGEVATRSAKVMNGVACKQSGTVTFKRHSRDPFWRLLDNENPCTGEREIVDIRMDPPPAPAAAPKKQAAQHQPAQQKK